MVFIIRLWTLLFCYLYKCLNELSSSPSAPPSTRPSITHTTTVIIAATSTTESLHTDLAQYLGVAFRRTLPMNGWASKALNS